MTKVYVTKDYLDGTRSRTTVPINIEYVDTTHLKLMLMEQGVASVTITRADLLKGLLKKPEEQAS